VLRSHNSNLYHVPPSTSGYYGTRCENTYACTAANCTALNRDKCTSANFCGPCLNRYASNTLAFTGDNLCELFNPTPVEVKSSASLYGTTGMNAADGDVVSTWSTQFNPLTTLAGNDQNGNIDDSNPYQFPYLQVKFDEQLAITRYDVVSSNADPSQDPKTWKVQGSNDGVAWALLDEQTGLMFDSRSERKTFRLKPFSKYNYVRLLVTDIRDAQFQGAVTINATTSSSSGANTTTSTTNVTTSSTYVPVLRVAEFSVYRDSTPVAGLAAPALTEVSHYSEVSTEQVLAADPAAPSGGGLLLGMLNEDEKTFTFLCTFSVPDHRAVSAGLYGPAGPGKSATVPFAIISVASDPFRKAISGVVPLTEASLEMFDQEAVYVSIMLQPETQGVCSIYILMMMMMMMLTIAVISGSRY